MPITLYRRGRFWWLTGTDATGTRVHQSTGFTEKVQADQIRIQREKEGLDARLLGRKAVYTFAQAVEDYLLAGGDDHFLEKLVLHFGDRRISSLTGTLVRAAAMELYPAAAYTTWNRQVVTPVRAVINMAADAGNCDPIKIKGFTTRDRNVRRPSTPKKRAVGLPYLGTHQPGRHSFATEMIVRNNVDVATTAEKGRWKSKGLLMETYVHGIEGQSVIDRVFGSTQPSSDEKRPSQ